jgi:apolipoprotein N-acyltransferase
MLFNPRLTQIYTKRYLTPFGEYIPARSIAEAVSPYAKEVRDFKGGTKEVIFGIKNATFNTLICYEILDDRLISEMRSNFVVVQTNNATFGDTQQLEQQLNIARVRSLELSRPIAYVSTTGITSFIDSQGRIDKAVDKFDTDALTGSIQLVEGQTLAQRFSKYIEPFSLFLLFLIVVKRVRKS